MCSDTPFMFGNFGTPLVIALGISVFFSFPSRGPISKNTLPGMSSLISFTLLLQLIIEKAKTRNPRVKRYASSLLALVRWGSFSPFLVLGEREWVLVERDILIIASCVFAHFIFERLGQVSIIFGLYVISGVVEVV